jgi:hypothetical protein
MPSGEVSRVTTNQKVTTVMLYVQLRHAPQLYLAADHDLPQQGRQPHRVMTIATTARAMTKTRDGW